ncbi:MAG: hypothetical protein WCD86_16910 [Ktedonobacteraceae bacterium]
MVTHLSEIDEPGGAQANISAQQDDAVSVPLERVDSYTLQVIGQLFPAPTNGIEFLALLLRWARVKQLSLGVEQSRDVAIITVQSIRELAKLIGLAYETTHKYILLFCALGLLAKRRANGKIELHFALGRYTPPLSLDELDRLVEQGRKKVKSCAKKVKRRYFLLYGEQQRAGLPSPATAGSSVPELDEAILDVQQLLEREPSETTRRNLATVLTKLERAQRRLGSEGDLVDSARAAQPADGRLPGSQVDSRSPMATRNGGLGTKTVDSARAAQPADGRLPRQTVDSIPAARSQNSRLDSQKSTVLSPLGFQNGRLLPKIVDSPANSSPQEVDSTASEAPNVNVILKTVIDQLNVNVRSVAAFLQTIFGEEPRKRGYYHNLYKQYAHAEFWLAAALETIVGQHQAKTVKEPGKYFYDRCVQLHQQQAIPPETRTLVEQYAHLRYPDLLRILTAPAEHPPGISERVSCLKAERPRLSLRLPRAKETPGMSEGDLKRLISLIRQDSRTCSLDFQPYRQADGSCALLVEDTMRHQRWIYSVASWQARVARMRTALDLFRDPGPG